MLVAQAFQPVQHSLERLCHQRLTAQLIPARVLTTGTRSGIVCVDAKDGALLWSNSWSANNTANCPDPAYADGHVFWANGYGKGGVCMKLKVDGGKVAAEKAWTTKDMVCHHGGYIIHKGYIYGNHSGGWTCRKLHPPLEQRTCAYCRGASSAPRYWPSPSVHGITDQVGALQRLPASVFRYPDPVGIIIGLGRGFSRAMQGRRGVRGSPTGTVLADKDLRRDEDKTTT